VRIISEPKNSLVKQYMKLFDMDGVKLTFTEEALGEVASLALERNTGARGLRSILEKMMTRMMFEIPSRGDIAEVQITPAFVRGEGAPTYVLKQPEAPAQLGAAE
jgi:ATP-dependent Clp protease ATP-binding subunit ClpX